MKSMLLLLLAAMTPHVGSAKEYHVSVNGSDMNGGSASKPFKTISAAARVAQPGDVITVHAGVYRERVSPPRGGTSDTKRIVYQAARGEKVEIKGSEVVTNWVKVQNEVWKVTLPNAFFGSRNPYSDLIHGDWFDPRGREHHTGAVYLNGDWLIEAAKLEEVLMPPGTSPAWLNQGGDQYLLNVAWLQPGKGIGMAGRIPATRYTAKKGTQTAPCSEGGECIGFIESGHWVRYENVDFGSGTEQIEIRAASASGGGIIELRLDQPDGVLLGTCVVPNTGDWQDWASFQARIKPVSGIKTLCLVFKCPPSAPLNAPLWFGRVDATNTIIWAQFPGVNPNEQRVEINVRRTVFYPEEPGINYITVRGFTLRDAATPWAPPTAEQIGLIGTHWSKGWIIENNLISHSVCSGIALGKHGDEFDNTSANSAEGYVKTIERAHAFRISWTRQNIGHHVVRNNTISHCEQAGVVGSLGAAFSTVTGNTIHDIHVRRLFSGAEMAGIKFHAAIDTVIGHNHIYRTCLGLWLDWMAQGTRVSRNLFHDNASNDLFVEVDHGPFMVDNNLFLSAGNLLDMSEGGAYAHNLFAGKITNRPEPSRETPFHPAHSTTVAGLVSIKGGDDRFYNNIFVGNGETLTSERKGDLKELRWISSFGLWSYDGREQPLQTGGNVYYRGEDPYDREAGPTAVELRDLRAKGLLSPALSSKGGERASAKAFGKSLDSTTIEAGAIVLPGTDPRVKLVQEGDRFILQISPGARLKQAGTVQVATGMLGRAKTPGLAYEQADGSPLRINTDYFGKRRSAARPTAGPFERPGEGDLRLKVW